MEKKYLNVVCAVIHDGDRFLCTQRLRKGPEYIAEHWEFPGGKVKEGEMITRLCDVNYTKRWIGISM